MTNDNCRYNPKKAGEMKIKLNFNLLIFVNWVNDKMKTYEGIGILLATIFAALGLFGTIYSIYDIISSNKEKYEIRYLINTFDPPYYCITPTNKDKNIERCEICFINCPIPIKAINDGRWIFSLHPYHPFIANFIDSVFKSINCEILNFPVVFKTVYVLGENTYENQSLYIFKITNDGKQLISVKYVRKISNNLKDNPNIKDKIECQKQSVDSLQIIEDKAKQR
jgi:hypothetical protein